MTFNCECGLPLAKWPSCRVLVCVCGGPNWHWQADIGRFYNGIQFGTSALLATILRWLALSWHFSSVVRLVDQCHLSAPPNCTIIATTTPTTTHSIEFNLFCLACLSLCMVLCSSTQPVCGLIQFGPSIPVLVCKHTHTPSTTKTRLCKANGQTSKEDGILHWRPSRQLNWLTMLLYPYWLHLTYQ